MEMKVGSKEIGAKKRKKLDMKNSGGDENVVKKKKKLDRSLGKETAGKSSVAKVQHKDPIPNKAAIPQKAKPKPTGAETAKQLPAGQKDDSKPKATVAPLQNKIDDGDDGKTMDYKLFKLKKMKEKWKNQKTKRQRKEKPGKPKKAEAKAPKSDFPSKKSLPNAPAKKFGPCDFSELSHFWNEYASGSLTEVERGELILKPHFLFENKKGRKPSQFFSKRIPDWSEWTQKKLPNGSPQIIVLCPSDVRAVEMNRELMPFKGEKCRTAKLIPKEKTKEQTAFLESKNVHMAIGTPHRIGVLISNGSLKLDECLVIALDWSFKDAKQRRLITIPEVRHDVLELFRKKFIPLFKKREEVALFLL